MVNNISTKAKVGVSAVAFVGGGALAIVGGVLGIKAALIGGIALGALGLIALIALYVKQRNSVQPQTFVQPPGPALPDEELVEEMNRRKRLYPSWSWEILQLKLIQTPNPPQPAPLTPG